MLSAILQHTLWDGLSTGYLQDANNCMHQSHHDIEWTTDCNQFALCRQSSGHLINPIFLCWKYSHTKREYGLKSFLGTCYWSTCLAFSPRTVTLYVYSSLCRYYRRGLLLLSRSVHVYIQSSFWFHQRSAIP